MKTPQQLLEEMMLDEITLKTDEGVQKMSKFAFEKMCRAYWHDIEIAPLDESVTISKMKIEIYKSSRAKNLYVPDLSSASRRLFNIRELMRCETIQEIRFHILEKLKSDPNFILSKQDDP